MRMREKRNKLDMKRFYLIKKISHIPHGEHNVK